MTRERPKQDLPPELPGLPLRGPAHLSAQTWYVLNRAAQRARELVEEALVPLGLRRRHYSALGVLADEGPMSQQGLSDRVPVDRASLVTIIDDLERLGLAERRPDPGDRRAWHVALTAEGRRMLKDAQVRIAAAEELALAPLSADERHHLDTLARRLCGWGPRRT